MKPIDTFRPGDWVQVKNANEILATLDGERTLAGLSFMPEMFAFCGHRFRVAKRALKTCEGGVRALSGMVHLEGAYCDGRFHGGCDCGCNLYWKTEWLLPCRPGQPVMIAEQATPHLASSPPLVQLMSGEEQQGKPRFRCQATEMFGIDTPRIRPTQLSSYIRDFSSGNVGLRELKASSSWLWNHICWKIRLFVHRRSQVQPQTPSASTLKPGDLVRVRSGAEIMRTLDSQSRHKGLEFNTDMARFCGKEFRVSRRIEHVIDPTSGHLKQVRSPSVVLEGVTCGGKWSFCPRQLDHFWREVWLERIETPRSSEVALSRGGGA